MKKSVIDTFLKEKPKRKLLHVHVEESVYKQVREKMKIRSISWQELVDACFKSWLK